MEAERFESIVRALAAGATRRHAARLLAGSVFGGLLGARLLAVDAKKKRKGKKVTVCHQGRTIRVAKKSNRTHLRHGDTAGPCPPPTCADDFRNGAETDIDCGGPDCPPCVNGLVCKAARDCRDNVCQGGVCLQCDPLTCAILGRECGTADDGCGRTLSCGVCDDPARPACNNGVCVACEDACPGTCNLCFNLSDGNTRCSFGGLLDCATSCDSGADCGEAAPDCLVSHTLRETNVTETAVELCPSATVGICSKANAC